MIFIQIAGHIGKDPEVRFTPDGRKVTTFSVATNKKVKGQDVTVWYRVTVWDNQFEKMMPYLKKGSAVIVLGDPESRIYTDKEGRPQISNEVTARHLSFSPFGKSNNENSSSNSNATTSPYAAKEEFAPSEPMKGSYQSSFSSNEHGDDDDALPF